MEVNRTDRSIALWHEAMFGLNYPDQASGESSRPSPFLTEYKLTPAEKQNYNNNAAVEPLRERDGLDTSKWFAHGYKAYPPVEGKFAELPAGGAFTG